MNNYHQKPKTAELDVVRAVCVKDGAVLLVQEADDPNWKLPGGKIHAEETVFEALARELKEELAVEISKSQILNYVAAPIPDSDNERHIFLMDIGTGPFAKTEEVAETGYFSLDKLPETKFAGHIASAAALVS